jgi:uncharacterized membrane protein (DUF2068 family)
MNFSHDAMIRCIGAFKLFKTACLIVIGFGLLKLIHRDVGTQLENWVATLGFDPGSGMINHAIQKATDLSPARFKEFGVVSFVYAGLFLAEGIGLCLKKRWAEWFTVVITSSLLPFEIFEIIHRRSVIKVFVLILNIVVVIYLLFRIAREGRATPNKRIVGVTSALRSR